jgi:hypothetical protein
LNPFLFANGRTGLAPLKLTLINGQRDLCDARCGVTPPLPPWGEVVLSESIRDRNQCQQPSRPWNERAVCASWRPELSDRCSLSRARVGWHGIRPRSLSVENPRKAFENVPRLAQPIDGLGLTTRRLRVRSPSVVDLCSQSYLDPQGDKRGFDPRRSRLFHVCRSRLRRANLACGTRLF